MPMDEAAKRSRFFFAAKLAKIMESVNFTRVLLARLPYYKFYQIYLICHCYE